MPLLLGVNEAHVEAPLFASACPLRVNGEGSRNVLLRVERSARRHALYESPIAKARTCAGASGLVSDVAVFNWTSRVLDLWLNDDSPW